MTTTIEISFAVQKTVKIQYTPNNYEGLSLSEAIRLEKKQKMENVYMSIDDIEEDDVTYYDVKVVSDG